MTKLKSKLTIMILVGAMTVHGHAAEPSKGKQLLRSETSPLGTLIVEYYSVGAERNEIWLRPQGAQLSAVRLYRYKRDAGVLFAPNENWLALNDYVGSNVSEVLLFKRNKDGKYLAMSQANVFDNVMQLLRKENGPAKKLSFGTLHMEGIRWAANSNFLLIGVSALADSGERIDSWLCLYDVHRFAATSDLSLMNRGVFVPRRAP